MKEINVDSAAVGAREEFFLTIILYPSSRWRWLKFVDSYDRDNMILKKLMKYNNNLGPGYCLKENKGTQRGYSSKPLKHSIVKRILVLKR